MIKWIINNKEWLFSGIGIILLVYLVKFVYWLFIRHNKEEQKNIIIQKYMDIVEHRVHGHSGIRGLIEAGAAQLSRNKDLIDICEKISMYGKPNPLDYWLTNNIKKNEYLKFIKWQAQNRIIIADYNNESHFKRLIERYKIG